MTNEQKQSSVYESPAVIVALAAAAYETGDKTAARICQDELLDRHGIELRFKRKPKRRLKNLASE
jgi:hypothetical protein